MWFLSILSLFATKITLPKLEFERLIEYTV